MSEAKITLSRRQNQAIVALLAHSTLDDAASSAGLSRQTLWRWLKCPVFTQSLEDARSQSFRATIEQIQSSASLAIQTLHRHLRSGDPAIEIRAAVALLRQSVDLGLSTEIEKRLSHAEASLQQLTQPAD